MATLLDSYAENNQNENQNLDDIFIKWGQSFTTPDDGISYTLDSCKFYLKKVASATGTLYARLYSHSGTYGTSSVGDALLATSTNTVDASTMSTTYSLITFNFDNTYSMVANTNYVIAVTSDDHSADDTAVGYDSTSPTHGGNGMYYALGAWAAQSTRDQPFYVYGTASATSGKNFLMFM